MRRIAAIFSLRIFATLSALLVAVAASSAVAQTKSFEGVTLTVGTFGGVWRDIFQRNVGVEVEKRGGKVQYVPGNPRDILAKLIAARGQTPPIDVMEIDDSTWSDIKARGFVEKLDPRKIPNLAKLDPSLYDEFKVAHWITEEGIIFNEAKFKEQGIPTPTKCADLLHPKLKGKVSFPNIMVNQAINGLTCFSAEKGGDESDIDGGLELVRQLDVRAYWNSPTEYMQLMKAGDIWAVFAHAGHAVRLNKAGVPVTMLHPPVKDKVGMFAKGYLGIAKGSKAVDAAHFFINGIVGEAAQTEILVVTGIVPTNKEVQANKQLRSENPNLDRYMMLDADEIAKMYLVDHSKVNMVQWNRKWNRMLVK